MWCAAFGRQGHTLPRTRHYLGIEKERSLVELGLDKELGPALRADKQPSIVISDAFEFSKLGQHADLAIAQSLFSHLPPSLINLCFGNLLPHMAEGGVFFATYFKSDKHRHNPDRSHDHGYFAYTQEEMCAFGEVNGWSAQYIGDWKHPREQVMVAYRRRIHA